MKNSTILKDELSLLNNDRSAVLKELRESSNVLKNIKSEIVIVESHLADLRGDIHIETARLDDVRGRAFSFQKEAASAEQEYKNQLKSYEQIRVKTSQLEKIHLGRIEDLKKKEDDIVSRIEDLKKIFDKNLDAINAGITERKKILKDTEDSINSTIKILDAKTKELQRKEEDEKKITKDRLKREDKLRIREKLVEARDLSLDKKEEDIESMAKDMSIIYGRLKELYFAIDPTVDLDKLITQPK